MGYRPGGIAASRGSPRPWRAGASVVTSARVTQYDRDLPNAESRSATDAAPDLFAPDLLLASQHAVARLPESPCRRLVAAVLERALLDAVGPTSKQPDRDDALAWIARSEERRVGKERRYGWAV